MSKTVSVNANVVSHNPYKAENIFVANSTKIEITV